MRKLVKVLEILISASTGTASTTGRGNRRVPRRLTAFIHIITIIIIIINIDTNPEQREREKKKKKNPNPLSLSRSIIYSSYNICFCVCNMYVILGIISYLWQSASRDTKMTM